MSQRIVLGQIGGDIAAEKGSELWLLSDAVFGQQDNLDGGSARLQTILLETQDYAPAGVTGRVACRKAYFGLGYAGQTTVRITPFIDFTEQLAQKQFAFGAPTQFTRTTLTFSLARMLTHVRFKIEVTMGTGRVELFDPGLAVVPFKRGFAVVGTAE